MTLITGIISRRSSLMKPQGTGRVYPNAGNLQSSLNSVDKSIQRPTVLHVPGSQKHPTRLKESSRGGKQIKHVLALETIAQEGDSTEDSGFFDSSDASTEPHLLRPLPLKLAGSAWWNIETSSEHSSANLTFLTSALDMPITKNDETGQLASHESISSKYLKPTSANETAALARASGSNNAHTILHPVVYQSRDDVSQLMMDSSLDKASAPEILNKPLPAKPALRNAESPERRGIIDAFESGAQALDEKHPALEPNTSPLISKPERDEQNKVLENSPNISLHNVNEELEAEKRLYEENVRRVRNNVSIENFEILNIEATDTTHKETLEIVQQKSIPLARGSPIHAVRKPQFSRIPQANVSLYGSPLVRRALTSTPSSLSIPRSTSGLRLQNDDPRPYISPRVKYGRKAPRIDPEADTLILGDDPSAQVTNSFRSMRSLRASKETEDLILNRCKTSYQGSPSNIPRASIQKEKFPPRVSSLKGSPESEKVEERFGKFTSTSQSANDRASHPAASNSARFTESRISSSARTNDPKDQAASGTVLTHSTRKSFSGRLSSMLPRRRTKSSADVEKTNQNTLNTDSAASRLSRDNGSGGCIADKRTFGFRKNKTAPGPVYCDEQKNLNPLIEENDDHQRNTTNLGNLPKDVRGREDKDDDNLAVEQKNTTNHVEKSFATSRRHTTSNQLENFTTQATGIAPRKVSGSNAIASIRGAQLQHPIARDRTKAPRDHARPFVSPAARSSTDATRSSMVHRETLSCHLTPTDRPTTTGVSASRPGSGRYSTGRHINIAGSSNTNPTGPPSVLDPVDPSVQEQYNETRTTRMLNTLMVDARISLDRARVIASTVNDSSLRERLLDLVQDERNMLDCLHHARRAHLAAGVTMFDLFRNTTNHVDELVDRSIDTVVEESA